MMEVIAIHTGASTAAQIDKICEWLEDSVCPRFLFKVPDNENITNVKKAKPKAYARYFPVRENLPLVDIPTVQINYTAPSIVVMPKAVSRQFDSARLDVHFLFTIWDPGEGTGFNYEAWRSLVNLQDETARQLAQRMHIGELTLELAKEGKSIDYGLVNDEEATPDLRPYYMGYMMASFMYMVAPVKYYGRPQKPTTNKLLD